MLDYLTGLFLKFYDIPALIALGGYVGLALIVFAETGLMVGFFLPGDSLLITAGLFAALGQLDIVLLNAILIPAAVLGDAFGYWFGSRVGRRLYERKDSFFFRRSHLLHAKAFYEKHGGKTIVLARFVPVVRTFAPIVAGVAEMPYSKFAPYNIFGAILWVGGTTLLGFSLGRVIPDIEKHLLIVIGVVIVLSFLPVFKEFWEERKAAKTENR